MSWNTLSKNPTVRPNRPSWRICFQSKPPGRRPSGAPTIMASRTANVVNASSSASVSDGIRCVRCSRWLSVVRTSSRLRALASAICVSEAPPVKNDIAR